MSSIPTTTCPSCHASLSDRAPDQARCPFCDAGLPPATVSEVPSAQPGAPPPFRTRGGPDIRALARRQRWTIWLILLVIISYVVMFGPRFPGFGMILVAVVGLLRLVTLALLIIGVVLMLTAQRTHWAVTTICAILMICPCVNLIVLVLVNASVNNTLRRAGLRVGLMGAKKEDVERVLNPALCTGCGYDLTGNVTGRCPECGRPCRPTST